MDLYGNMKLTDLAEYEKKSAILDESDNVLCPCCQKRLAIITKYGTVRNCKRCENKRRESFFISHDDCCGRRLG